MHTNQLYDAVIMGSGLGGLLCAVMLGKAGKRVCVIEKNKQLGGNLQTFSRNKQIFDTGVHYIGGLAKGQNLYQVFKYVGLMNALKLQQMSPGFDKILLDGDTKVYSQQQGYDRFIQSLSADFPEEEENIKRYCERVKEVCASFPLYNLTLEAGENNYQGNNESVSEVIKSITSNEKLQAVLAGNNLLYAAVADKTPFHVHALIINSYIESSWKCVGGGSQISKILAANIRHYKGDIIRNDCVVKIVENNGAVTYVETESGRHIYGKQFISNIHPAATLQLTESSLLKPLYRNRIAGLEQTVSSFSVHLVLKPGTVAYQNNNYYYHKQGKLWSQSEYEAHEWPLGYGLYFTEDKHHKGFAATVSVLTLMKYDDVATWQETYNRVGKENNRGEVYEAFKQRKADAVLKLVSERFPEIVHNASNCYTSTPLTNRDYIGDETGSIYGVQKDYKDPLKTMISPRTKIPNLFLTGQNLNLHGILGTSLSAVLTCTMVLNDRTLVDKIREM